LTKRILFIVSEDWYFVSHRLHLAVAAIKDGYKVGLLSKTSRHRQLLEETGIEVFDWSLNRRSSNIVLEVRAIADVVSAMKEFKPDLIHAVALKPVLYSSLAATITRTRSCVFALAGLGFIFGSKKWIAKLARPLVLFAFRLAFSGNNTRLILQNPDDQSVILSAGVIEKDKISLIRGAGVDTDIFAPKSNPQEPPIVILPARMLWDKGVREFVNCASLIKQQWNDVRFALVGDTDIHNPEAVPVEQLQQWDNEGVVEWWGHMDTMPEVYQQAAIICFPSSYREGLPKSLLEAASCARPIVTYDVVGCREIVVDGENGFLVPLKDEKALIKAVRNLLSDAKLRSRLGQAGRKMVLEEFSQEKVAAQTMQVWEDVLD